MVSRITTSSEFMAIERTADFLSVLTQEQDYQISGNVSNEQIVKLGKQFGVKYVAAVDAAEMFGSVFIAVRMIDVESGVVVASSELDCNINSMDTLVGAANQTADALLNNLLYPDLINKTVRFVGPYRSARDFGVRCEMDMKQLKFVLERAKQNNIQLKFPILLDWGCDYRDLKTKDTWEDCMDGLTTTGVSMYETMYNYTILNDDYSVQSLKRKAINQVTINQDLRIIYDGWPDNGDLRVPVYGIIIE